MKVGRGKLCRRYFSQTPRERAFIRMHKSKKVRIRKYFTPLKHRLMENDKSMDGMSSQKFLSVLANLAGGKVKSRPVI